MITPSVPCSLALRRGLLAGLFFAFASLLTAAEPAVDPAPENAAPKPLSFFRPAGLAVPTDLFAVPARPAFPVFQLARVAPHVWHDGLSPRLPVSLLPQAAVPSAAPASRPGASNPGWARRHALALAGLGMVAGGAALVATGKSTPSSGGCFFSPSDGNICVPPGPVWLGPQRMTGVVIAGLGVPVTILGLLKH